MLSLEDAVARCLAAVLAVRPEVVGIEAALGRVLAEAVDAPGPQPPWDNSAMDGFAVVAADFGSGHAQLQVLETIAAGAVGSHRVEPGSCSRIMTGAPMPAGADAVVIRENSEPAGDGVVRLEDRPEVGQHIRRAGAELETGARVLDPGVTLGAAHVGLCATLGLPRVTVARRPRVAIIATGDEVIDVGLPLGPGQIHSSNSHALTGWVVAAGGEPVDCGVARDTLQSTKAAFQRALDADCDIILSTGGVSVGDFDVVREAMAGVGAEMDFWKVRMKPGKPLAFGTIGGRPAFGLPGNPVSCQVGFLQFVRPVIRQSLGDPRPFLPVVDAAFVDGHRHRPGRAELVRVQLRLTDGGFEARRTGDQGSSKSSSMAVAHGLALIGVESAGLEPGETVAVQVFDWSFTAAADAGYRW